MLNYDALKHEQAYQKSKTYLNGDKEYIHEGIATRKFNKTFTLGEYIELEEVTLVDGILSIYLEKRIPDEKKPKRFKINQKRELLNE